MMKGGAVNRLITDQLGSVQLVVNATDGNIVQRIDYGEFGNATLVSGTWDFQPFSFAGGLYDPDTKLTRFGERDYDAETGRWTSKDPIGFSGGDANLFGYTENDPVNLYDHTGLIVSAGDSVGRLMLDRLSSTPAGHELIMYLMDSPLKYSVYGMLPIPADVAGQFGLVDYYERTECRWNGFPDDQIVRVQPTDAMNAQEKVITLGHELGHAALYDYYFLERSSLPSFLDPAWIVPSEPGGMEFSDDVRWTWKAAEIFQ